MESKPTNSENAKNQRPIDLEFMAKVLDSRADIAELALREILGKDDISVADIKAHNICDASSNNSVKIDIEATDSAGKRYFIEILKADNEVSPEMVRAYSALLDCNILDKYDNYPLFNEAYLIILLENDFLGAGKSLYHIERRVEGISDEAFNDGSHIIFVNTQYEGSDSIGLFFNNFSSFINAE